MAKHVLTARYCGATRCAWTFISVGQVVEVAGYPENFRVRWQLYVLEAKLERGERGWPHHYRYRSARRAVVVFDTLLDALFGTSGR
jgi:hypothetical protein